VLIRLKDVTTGKLFTKKLRMKRPDLGSAEWVAEAPSGCDLTGNCSTLPLTNFGTVSFSHSSATVKGHKGRISDPVWSATTIELHSDDPTHPSTAGANAIPGALGPDGGSFAVTWQRPPGS
jgi:Peptidase A4 family